MNISYTKMLLTTGTSCLRHRHYSVVKQLCRVLPEMSERQMTQLRVSHIYHPQNSSCLSHFHTTCQRFEENSQGSQQNQQNFILRNWYSIMGGVTVFGVGLYYYALQRYKKQLQIEKALEVSEEVGEAKIAVEEWELVDTDGKRFTNRDLFGKWCIFYFGFTHCPDICPDELDKLAATAKILEVNPSIPNIEVVFISVDPERDTTEIVKEYLNVLVIGIVQAVAAIGLICLSIVAIIVLILKCAIVAWKRNAGKESTRGKAVLITGCDTGFGYDLTKLLDEQGCTVFAGCLNADKNGAKDLMTSCSKRVHVIQMDVSKDDDVARALRYVSKHCSKTGLWAIVNNAGFNVMGDVEFLGPKLYLKAMDVNFYGAVRVTRAFLYLVRKSQGRVINISSGRGRFSWPRDSAYHVTKYCLETYNDSLRLEMKKFGVKVSVIEPGHFGGITACQDAVQFARYERERDEMWNSATDEMKGTYGEYYLQSLLDAQSKGLKSSATTTKPVMDAILDAMFSHKPDIRYLVSGSNGWFDKSATRSLGKTLFFWNMFLICHTPVLSLDSEDQNNVLELKIPWVRIPKVETYYVCQQFQVPSDKEYHVTQFDVIINNTAMVHHLLLFGCNFEMDEKGPHPCDSIDNHCHTWLTKWDVGMDTSDKMPPDAGVRFGKGSFKHLLLQIHWNNKYLLDNETDESGIRLTYTDKLRQYDIGHVQVGQNKIEIPANTEEVTVTGKCSSKCTGLMLPRSIYVSRAYLHMHQLGISTTLDVQRDREVVHRLASEFNYNYTSPIVHTFSPAINVNPGKGTIHNSNGIIIQRDTGQQLEPSTSMCRDRKRTIEAPAEPAMHYQGQKRRGPIQFQDENLDLSRCPEVHTESIVRDRAYFLTKYCQTDGLLPGWTGWNHVLHKDSHPINNVGYLPIIDSSPTDKATVLTILEKSLEIAHALNLLSIVLVMDQAIYAKAQEIRWQGPLAFRD